MPLPPASWSIFVFIRQVAVLFRHNNIFVFFHQVAPVMACWLFKTSATSWPFDLESGVRLTCDMGYLCANFSLPTPLCSRIMPDVHDRQTYVTQKHRLMPSPCGGQRHNNLCIICNTEQQFHAKVYNIVCKLNNYCRGWLCRYWEM